VLPFANLSSDSEQEYFVDAVTDDLTTDLSRIPDSFVIARNTASTIFSGRNFLWDRLLDPNGFRRQHLARRIKSEYTVARMWGRYGSTSSASDSSPSRSIFVLPRAC